MNDVNVIWKLVAVVFVCFLMTYCLLRERLCVFSAHFSAHSQRDRLHLLPKSGWLVWVGTLTFFCELCGESWVTILAVLRKCMFRDQLLGFLPHPHTLCVCSIIEQYAWLPVWLGFFPTGGWFIIFWIWTTKIYTPLLSHFPLVWLVMCDASDPRTCRSSWSAVGE